MFYNLILADEINRVPAKVQSNLAELVCSKVNDWPGAKTMTDNARTSLDELAGDLENETSTLTAAVGLLLAELRSDHDLDTFGPVVSRLYVTASALGHSAKLLRAASSKTYTTPV